ncbi:MAG: SgcJ/EcaC family oxidoreductase [Planctomycetia bacterium]|nr:SgcJ/EcaC family oxidoreductase [Planctomycetia bacterium]
MRLAITLTGSALALTAICLAAGDEPAPSRRAAQTSAQTAAQGSTKGTAKPGTPQTATAARKSPAATAAKGPATPGPADEKNSADQEAIRETGETFALAYNKGDAKAVAAHFTPDAEYVDEQGNVFEGRQAIEESLTAFFVENPGSQLEVTIDTIRVVSPGVAIEDGTTTLTHPAGGPSDFSRYTTVHVKTHGKWLTASSREHAPKNRRQHSAQLQQLDWLLGDWVDEDDDSIVEFACQAVENGNFLLRQFTVKIAGQEAMTGTQRIGWDPVSGKLRAWVFDSEGGYGEGTWHRDGDNWVLKTSGVTADGQTASGTSIYTFVSEHIMTWQAVDHEIAGVQLPDSEVVAIVRKPPSPTAAETPVAKK